MPIFPSLSGHYFMTNPTSILSINNWEGKAQNQYYIPTANK